MGCEPYLYYNNPPVEHVAFLTVKKGSSTQVNFFAVCLYQLPQLLIQKDLYTQQHRPLYIWEFNVNLLYVYTHVSLTDDLFSYSIVSLIVCRTHHGACVVFKLGFIYDCGEKNQTLEPVSPQYLGLDCTLHEDMWAGHFSWFP